METSDKVKNDITSYAKNVVKGLKKLLYQYLGTLANLQI